MENLSYKTPSTSLQDGSPIYGRDKDKEAIIKLLLDDNNNGDEVSVIPIVGIGGVGKTTLAQLVYNDDNLKNVFDFKAWVCVSEQFDIMRVTKTITQAVTRKTCEMNDLNILHLELQEKLRGKKFLIVLDDVWIEDYDNWNLLRKPFQGGMRGSKILVTTRNRNVASIVQTVQTYPLIQLSNEDCWLVFTNHACISSGPFENTTTLKKIGMEIVKKCKGLPLAAQSLGGILRRKQDIRDWNNILNSDIWQLSESESKIIPALRISYHYLPSHLKRCFVYCSLFPKDYEFEKKELILLWMAEDLLPPPKTGNTLEEVGYECFDYLTSRSFLQRSSTKWRETFVMHDLMHDLATSLGGEFYSRLEKLGEEAKIHVKTRHLSFTKFSGPILENSEVFGRAKCLRTLLSTECGDASEEAPHIQLLKLKYVRVLSLYSFHGLNALPDSIGELIHLRYLDLSETDVESLPESLCNLYHLQTLKLDHCDNLTMLPSGMQNLVNLHHLGISQTPVEEMPKGMSKLKQLQHLPYFIVGKHEEMKINQLEGLSNLHGSLSVRKLENVGNCGEALEAKMMTKKHINHLALNWSSDEVCTYSETEMNILCKLQPHHDLQVLEVNGYRGTRFPIWVGNSYYHNMTGLKLSSCKNCCMLPSLGHLPSLKQLIISDLNGLETIDVEFFLNKDSALLTPFPSLEYLKISGMPCLEVWSSFEPPCAFPKLRSLVIENCPKLRGDLQSHLPALEQLEIKDCRQLACSLSRAPSMRRLVLVQANKVTWQEFPIAIEYLEIGVSSVVMKSMFEAIINRQPTCLQSLESRDCSFPNLEQLNISDCENLESLSVSQSWGAALQNLSSLRISSCPSLVSLAIEGLAVPNLTSFTISFCDKLKSLPRRMDTLLPKLKLLEISNCPRIESFPEEGVPPSLRELAISNCEKLLSSLTWPSMNMLTHLWLYGPCDGIKSFPEQGLLPPSLVSISVCEFSNLETFNFEGLLHLTSLQTLRIVYCPKLENMAGGRLPASLTELHIYGCPLLGEQCRMKHTQIWPKISHIPSIYVDERRIS